MLLPDTFSLLVLGLGSTGSTVAAWGAKHLGDRVASVTVYAGATSAPSPATAELEAMGVRVITATEKVEGSFDICVASPGISEFSDFYASARMASCEIMGEPEFSYRLSPREWVAITGTNGKTTTTTLVNYMFELAGLSSVAVGNIGTVPLSCVDDRAQDELFVAELSSFQLACTSKFHPRTAALLNITPDHVAWHKTHQNYIDAKLKVFDNMGPDDLAVVCVADEGSAAQLDRISKTGVRVCELGLEDTGASNAAFVRDNQLMVRRDGKLVELCQVDDMLIAGQHNVMNALAASALALEIGLSATQVVDALKSFSALEHRIEPVCTVGDVEYFNDSKATNTDATLKALTAFPEKDIVLMLGGHDKGTELEQFCETVCKTVKAVICFGDARDRFLTNMVAARESYQVEIAEADHLLDAIDVAYSIAEPGDVVLFSPACSSFDEFSGYEERGERFKELVHSLKDRD